MRVKLGMSATTGKGANTDPKLRVLRKAGTQANEKYGIGGRLKTQGAPKSITLPRLTFTEPTPE